MSADRSVGPLRGSFDGYEGLLRYLGIARIGVLSFVTVGAALDRGQSGLGYLLPLYFFGFVVGIWYLGAQQRRGARGIRHAWAQVIVDFAVVASTVAFTQGPMSFFSFIFVIVVLEAGLLIGLRQAFILSTLCSSFMLVQAFTPPLDLRVTTFNLWYNFFAQCMAFYLTAFISGYWSQRIHRLQEFQREILDNMSSGFLITDAHGTVTVQNRAAGEILGQGDDESVGRHVSEVLRVDSGGECPVVTALRSGKDFMSYEFHVRRGSEESRLLGLTTNRMINAKGEMAGLIVSFTDLTEMDDLRQYMRRQDRMAAVGELAAGLAHEIRNPVAVIRGAMDEMGRKPTDENITEKLRTMAVRESDHLNEIVSGFLDFAREPVIRRENFDMCELVHEVETLLEREQKSENGISVVGSYPEAPCLVSADRHQIKQVLVNLGKNAIEAMDSEGKLEITVTSDQGPAEVHFDDEGPGIEPDKVARIFEPFYTTKESGVGMGLAVCSRIITAHDGTLRASSREGGRGCSMVMSLPRSVED